MLTPAEQAILSQLQEKKTAAETQLISPPVNSMDAINRLVNLAVEQKMAEFQKQTNVQQKKDDIMSSKVNDHADFIEAAKKQLLNSLTLTQSGKLFALAMKSGDQKEKVFKDAILGFLTTDAGVAIVQMAVDSFLTEVDNAGKQT